METHTPPIRRGAGAVARTPRRPALLLVLFLLILAPLLAYAHAAVQATRDVRVRHALDRNRALALLSSRLLDEQCDTALSALDILAKRRLLAAALRAGDRASVRRHLGDAVETVPDLQFAAAFRADGAPVGSYPASAPAPSADAVRAAPWFRDVLSSGRPYVGAAAAAAPPRGRAAGGARVIALAVRVADGARPAGCVLAYYRLGQMNAWLRQVNPGPRGGVYVTDAAGRLVAASVRARPLPGAALAELLGPGAVAAAARSGAARSAPLPDDPDRRVLVGHAVAAVPRWTVLVVQPEDEAIGPTNHLVRRLSLLFAPMLGLVLGGTWLLRNLFAREERMAERLALQNERLREADRMKSDFLATVSHDLRAPLTSINTFVTGLLDSKIELDPEQVRGCLQLVSEETDLLAAKVRNLLVMARLEADPAPPRRDLCELTDIVGAALERLRPLTRDRAVTADFPPEPLFVEGDHGQIETVVLNLVENAVKYSPPGAPIALRGEQRDGEVLCFVRDRGVGVAPGEEARVFERFYRASSAGSSTRGTGLGLAISKSIVEGHGGRIGVRNALDDGGGAEFWFALPAAAPAFPDSEAPPASPQEITP